MPNYQLTFGKVIISLSIAAANYPNDEDTRSGDGAWTFKRAELEAVGLEKYRAAHQSQTENLFSQLEEADKENYEENYDDDNYEAGREELETTNPDLAIMILAVLREKGEGVYAVGYNTDGSAYWALHDLYGHSVGDCLIADDDTLSMTVEGSNEEQAMIAGARAALEHNVCDIADVVREFVQVEPDFLARFRYRSQALDNFLEGIKVELVPLRS